MISMNRLTVLGRVGAEITLRTTKAGKPVAQFPVATSRKYRDEKNEEVQDTQWHRVVAWGKQAESCAKYLNKGDMVMVEGMVKSKRYEGKDGQDRMSFEVHADLVNFLEPSMRQTSGRAENLSERDETDLLN